jgi:hypothetical protein
VSAGCVGGEREAVRSQGGGGAMRRWSPLVAGDGFGREVAVAGLIWIDGRLGAMDDRRRMSREGLGMLEPLDADQMDEFR